MSRATDLGDLVVTSLNDASFSMEFTSARKYRPISELKDLSTLTVTVLVPTVRQEITSRSMSSDTITVDVLVQKQANADDNDIVDPLIDLVEEIGAHFRGLRFTHAEWLTTELVSHYDMEDIASYRLFSSLLRMTYICYWRPA